MRYTEINGNAFANFQNGTVIPALPLALDKNRKLDIRRQKALLRYYFDAGAGGVAVGVHTTQFDIRLPGIDLYEPVLEIAKEEFDNFEARSEKPVFRIAGVIGKTKQAEKEARLALEKGYHAILLSVSAFAKEGNQEIIDHCRSMAQIMPVVGFYLQPAVGGRILNVDFWREFASIENVIGIKIAPFNRYQTFNTIRGVAESGRADSIALYTGNDDNIVVDLLSEYQIHVDDRIVIKRIVGGLLGHWAVWTHSAVQLLKKIKNNEFADINSILVLANQITDANAAFFDSDNNFAGCIAGIHEILRRQGLLEGIWTLNEKETLSPGQMEEIDRIYSAYPQLNDDRFVKDNLHKWLD